MTDPSKYPKKEIDRFDDVFHQHNDDIDEDQDKYVDFDNLYQTFHTDDNDDYLLDVIQHEEENVVTEEQQLSQKLSQLSATAGEKELPQEAASVHIESEQSTTTTTKKRPSLTPTTSTSETVTKKIKVTNVDEETDAQLPRFLSRTNDVFQENMKPLLEKAASTINIEHLRKIALIKFHIAVNDLDISLWTAYLRSGTGNLQQSEQLDPQQAITTATSSTRPHLKRWPTDVKQIIIKSRGETNTNNKVDGDTCLNYVYKMLRQFRDQNTHCYNELRERKQRLMNTFTMEIEEAVDKFVEQYGTTFHRVPIDGQIATVEYKYRDQLILLEFYEQTPLQYQVDVFKNISKLKYDKETAKMGVAILKQRLVYNHLPSSFESLHIPEPITLNTIQNDTIRQRLSEQYHKVLQRTKSDMLSVYIATEQAKSDERIKEFDQDYLEMKGYLRTGPTHKKFTPTMLSLLQKRLKNINEHIMYLYNLKMHFFAKAPTVKN